MKKNHDGGLLWCVLAFFEVVRVNINVQIQAVLFVKVRNRVIKVKFRIGIDCFGEPSLARRLVRHRARRCKESYIVGIRHSKV